MPSENLTEATCRITLCPSLLDYCSTGQMRPHPSWENVAKTADQYWAELCTQLDDLVCEHGFDSEAHFSSKNLHEINTNILPTCLLHFLAVLKKSWH